MSQTLTIHADDLLADALRARAQSQGRRLLNRREREHAWRRSNRDLLQSRYAGQWVVLEGEEILAHGKDAVSSRHERPESCA